MPGETKMIEITKVWTSESSLENYQSVTAEFYNIMCNRAPWTIDEIRELDDKAYFSFYCDNCEQMHAEQRGVWACVAATLTSHTPPEGHPEREEYVIRRKGFLQRIKLVDVRDFAEPYLRADVEGTFIDGAIKFHQQVMEEFHELICASTISLESTKASTLRAYFCAEHDTIHYLSGEDSNFYRRQISGSKVPPQFAEHLSKLGARIVLRDINAAYREFDANHPWENVENKIASLKNAQEAQQRAEEKSNRQRLHVEAENAAKLRKAESAWKLQKQEEEAQQRADERQRRHAEEQVQQLLAKKLKQQVKVEAKMKAKTGVKVTAKAKVVVKVKTKKVDSKFPQRTYQPSWYTHSKKHRGKTQQSESKVEDQRFYILPPHLMTEEWLVEYQVCGRKKTWDTFAEADEMKKSFPLELKDIYECPFCSKWHWGHKNEKAMTTDAAKNQAKRGLFWYQRNHVKANIFIHRIMHE